MKDILLLALVGAVLWVTVLVLRARYLIRTGQ